MNELTTSRLMLHTVIPISAAAYLLWSQVSYGQMFVSLFIILVMDLIYLSSVIIANLKPKPSTMLFDGMNVLITGGNSGIGFALAKQLLSSGCRNIVLLARNEDRLKSCVKELDALKSDSQRVSYLSMDLCKDTEIDDQIKKLIDNIGTIDVLINCAGFSVPGQFQHLEKKTFKEMIDTNYLGSVYLTHAIIPHMIKQKFGHVVFLSSVGGQLGVTGFTAYSPSKYAVRGFAEVLQSEMRPYGIGVSLVFPPDTKTPGFETENMKKPNATRLISEQAGLWESDNVAKIIKSGVENRQFMIGFGTDGYFVNALTCGGAPPGSVLEFWSQCLLMPFLRVYILFLQNHFANIISNEHKRSH